MSKLRFLLIGFLVFNFALISNAQNQNKIDRLFTEKKTNAEWHKKVLDQIKSDLLNLDPVQVLLYLNKLESSYNVDTKSDEKLELVLLKIQTLNKLGEYDKSLKEVNFFLDKLGSSAKTAKYARVWIEFSDIYYWKGNLDSSTVILDIAKELVKVESKEYYAMMISQASLLYGKGNAAEAIKLTQKAIRYYTASNDDNALAVAYNNLGDQYNSLKQPLEAAKYFLEAAEINKKIGDKQNLCMNYNNAGSVFSKANQLNKAINYYQMAFELAKELNNPMLMAQNILNRGNVYEKMKDFKMAKKSFLECLEICEKHGINFGIMLSFINLGNLSTLTKEYEQADAYLKKALALTQTMNLPFQRALVFERQAKLYFEMGDFKQAYFTQNLFHSLNDSLFNEKSKKEVLTLKEKFESERKTNKINLLNKEKLRQQLIIALMGIGGLILALGLQRFRLKHQLAIKEMQQDELQKKYLQAKLDGKDKELTAQAAQLLKIQNDIALSNVKLIKLIDAEKSLSEENRKKIKTNLQKNPFTDLNLDLEKRITEANTDFYKILLEKYPDLTPSELKLCAYLRLSISTKEIADLTNRSIRTVETLRTDIRKKMNLSAQENLSNHLITLT